MTKAQRENAERLMLQQTLKNNPKMKEIIDNMINNPNLDVQSVVTPVIEEQLKKARMQGVVIGWQGFALRAIENIKNMTSIEEVKEYFQNEANNAREKLNLPNTEAIEDSMDE